MRILGMECLSTFGLNPVDLVHLTADLGCTHVTLNLSPSRNRLPEYAEFSFRDDKALQRAVGEALKERGVAIGLVEGVTIMPENRADDHAVNLDMLAGLGAKAICTVSIDRDLPRTLTQFNRLSEMAAERGMFVTTEVGAMAMKDLPTTLEAIRQIAHPAFKLLIDTMHFFRTGSTVADLAALPPELIGHVQLCDVPMPAVIEKYMYEAMNERRAPGDGDLPLADVLRHVPEHVVIGIEVPLRAEAEAGIGPHARLGRVVERTRALFAEVDQGAEG